MRSLMIAFPVTCRRCGVTSLSKFPILVVATALIKWHNMRLYSGCHTGSWDASRSELAAIRCYLGVDWLDTHRRELAGGIPGKYMVRRRARLPATVVRPVLPAATADALQPIEGRFIDLRTWRAGPGYLH